MQRFSSPWFYDIGIARLNMVGWCGALLFLAGCGAQNAQEPAAAVADAPDATANSQDETAASNGAYPLGEMSRGFALVRPETPSSDAPVHQLTVREFYDESKADAQKTLAKYRGAWIELTGEVEQVGTTPDGRVDDLVLVRLIADPPPGEENKFRFDFVNC